MKLTTEQRATLGSCLELGAAWVTGRGSDNDRLLAEWAERGWTEQVIPPAGSPTLTAYRFTPAGREALKEQP